MGRKILVTNDDGIDAPGLWALVRAVAPLGELWVVAPTENQSAVGAGLTLRRELRWERYAEAPVPGVEAWHVNGTPGDCVMIAEREIVKDFDLVVSGINHGANLGRDILASGTVGGALQGHFRDITSVAFSQVVASFEHLDEVDWSTAERVAALVTQAVTDSRAPAGPVFLNVNMPLRPFEALRGMLVTRMGRHGFLQLAESGGQSGVVDRELEVHTNPDTPPGTDIWAIANGYVSVSPLQSNLTDHRLIDQLGQRLNGAFPR
ncbi:MAG: 5'/3'-nucleotidase SurE [Dehalococcoidia bacterium]